MARRAGLQAESPAQKMGWPLREPGRRAPEHLVEASSRAQALGPRRRMRIQKLALSASSRPGR